MSKLPVIVGSTRPGRAADLVVPWITSRARAHGGFDVEVADPTYSEPIVRAWNQKLKQADAFLVVTPEYNHSIPAVLKNAIDTVWQLTPGTLRARAALAAAQA